MGLSVTNIKRLKGGNFYQQISEITFDSSYATGGEVLTPRELGLNVIDFVDFESAGGYLFQYDHVNQKVKVFTPTKAVAAHTHSENAEDTYTKDATTGAGGAVEAAAASEVASATNLSTLVTRLKATGW